MGLYEIKISISECFDAETGELIDSEKLDALEMEYGSGSSRFCCMSKNMRAEADAIKAEKLAPGRRGSRG